MEELSFKDKNERILAECTQYIADINDALIELYKQELIGLEQIRFYKQEIKKYLSFLAVLHWVNTVLPCWLYFILQKTPLGNINIFIREYPAYCCKLREELHRVHYSIIRHKFEYVDFILKHGVLKIVGSN